MAIVPNRIRHNSTQSSCQLLYQHRVMQLGECWGASSCEPRLSGTFAKLSRIFREISLVLSPGSRNCKHLHSPSEQLQVVASLSGLRLPRLLVCDSGDRNRRVLYALPGRAGHRNLEASVRKFVTYGDTSANWLCRRIALRFYSLSVR